MSQNNYENIEMDEMDLDENRLTQFPTSDIVCIDCSRIVRTVTTYSPGPLACCLGTMSFLSG